MGYNRFEDCTSRDILQRPEQQTQESNEVEMEEPAMRHLGMSEQIQSLAQESTMVIDGHFCCDGVWGCPPSRTRTIVDETVAKFRNGIGNEYLKTGLV